MCKENRTQFPLRLATSWFLLTRFKENGKDHRAPTHSIYHWNIVWWAWEPRRSRLGRKPIEKMRLAGNVTGRFYWTPFEKSMFSAWSWCNFDTWYFTSTTLFFPSPSYLEILRNETEKRGKAEVPSSRQDQDPITRWFGIEQWTKCEPHSKWYCGDECDNAFPGPSAIRETFLANATTGRWKRRITHLHGFVNSGSGTESQLLGCFQ